MGLGAQKFRLWIQLPKAPDSPLQYSNHLTELAGKFCFRTPRHTVGTRLVLSVLTGEPIPCSLNPPPPLALIQHSFSSLMYSHHIQQPLLLPCGYLPRGLRPTLLWPPASVSPTDPCLLSPTIASASFSQLSIPLENPSQESIPAGQLHFKYQCYCGCFLVPFKTLFLNHSYACFSSQVSEPGGSGITRCIFPVNPFKRKI